MSLSQLMFTALPRLQQNRAENKPVTSVFSLLPEPSLLGRAGLPGALKRVCMGSVREKMDFRHVLTEYLHQRKLGSGIGEEGSDVC